MNTLKLTIIVSILFYFIFPYISIKQQDLNIDQNYSSVVSNNFKSNKFQIDYIDSFFLNSNLYSRLLTNNQLLVIQIPFPKRNNKLNKIKAINITCNLDLNQIKANDLINSEVLTSNGKDITEFINVYNTREFDSNLTHFSILFFFKNLPKIEKHYKIKFEILFESGEVITKEIEEFLPKMNHNI